MRRLNNKSKKINKYKQGLSYFLTIFRLKCQSMFKIYNGDYQWDRAKEIRKKKGQEKNEIYHRQK